jgi:hypothetical protein
VKALASLSGYRESPQVAITPYGDAFLRQNGDETGLLELIQNG